MRTFNSLFMTLASIGLFACSTASNRLAWDNFNNDSVAKEMQSNQGMLVFYRAHNEADTAAVNVSIDGEYVSSLLVGGHIHAPVCASTHQITAIPTGKDPAYADKNAQRGASLNIQAGQTAYIKIHSNGNVAHLQQIDAQTAEAELAHTKKQAHTLPRLSANASCAH